MNSMMILLRSYSVTFLEGLSAFIMVDFIRCMEAEILDIKDIDSINNKGQKCLKGRGIFGN